MTETIESAKALCRAYMADNIPVWVEGPPGVGKSELWQQLAAERNVKLIDLRLAQMDPVDLRGLPKVEKELTTWARPDFWPDVKRDGKEGIILFDEAADCSRAMQSAMYQIVLEGRAGPHVIPPGWYRCAAGNNQKHKAGAQAISTALANRFAWITVDVDWKCLKEHATRQGWHHYVLGFLEFRQSMLHTMDGATEKAFASPRSWEKVSRLCFKNPETSLFRLARGLVGEGPAGEFDTFLKALDLPSLEDIVKNPKNCHIPAQPSSRYALGAMLARGATRDNLAKIGQYVARPAFGRDFEVCLFLDACKRDATLTETRAYIDFANRNQDLSL